MQLGGARGGDHLNSAFCWGDVGCGVGRSELRIVVGVWVWGLWVSLRERLVGCLGGLSVAI